MFDALVNILISVALEAVLPPVIETLNPPVIQTHYGSFETLFGFHTLGIGEM